MSGVGPDPSERESPHTVGVGGDEPGDGGADLAGPGDDVVGEADSAVATGVGGDADAADAPGPGPDVVGEISELDAVTSERDQYLDDLRRVSAEFANFRRQTEKRNAEVAAQSGARIAEALLVVFDACEAASRQGIEGVEPIALQLRNVLAREGLEEIRDDGEPFDPARHEATLSEPGDGADGDDPVVVETLRTGYAWNGRVLRAAMVKVRG